MELDRQHVWYFLLTLFFVALVALSMAILDRYGSVPTEVKLFDALLILFATVRVVRLFTYDMVMQWFRDLFTYSETRLGDPGERIVVRQAYGAGLLRTMSDLLGCPWCFGVWAAFMVSFFYFLTPLAWYPIFALAIAGAASFLMLVANLVGWHAEHKKWEHERARAE
jgi:hypothetical protein